MKKVLLIIVLLFAVLPVQVDAAAKTVWIEFVGADRNMTNITLKGSGTLSGDRGVLNDFQTYDQHGAPIGPKRNHSVPVNGLGSLPVNGSLYTKYASYWYDDEVTTLISIAGFTYTPSYKEYPVTYHNDAPFLPMPSPSPTDTNPHCITNANGDSSADFNTIFHTYTYANRNT